MRCTTAGSRNGSPVLFSTNTAIGTPQARWRLMHQSGPAGDHAADAVAALVRHEMRLVDRGQRLVADVLRPVHADEPLRRRAENQRRLASARNAGRNAPACRAPAGRRPRSGRRRPGRPPCRHARRRTAAPRRLKVPSSPTVSGTSMPCARPRSKSSSPWPGAMWTKPVPGSVVTKSPAAAARRNRSRGRATDGAQIVPARSAPFSTCSTWCVVDRRRPRRSAAAAPAPPPAARPAARATPPRRASTCTSA